MSPQQPAARSNEDWLVELRDHGPRNAAALADLREYLLRAILVYLTRQRSDLGAFDYDELRQLAEDWAQQSLLQVLDSIDSFRGDSKFTTWAYRISVNLAAAALRRKRWESLSLESLTESESPDVALKEDTTTLSPEIQVTRRQVWAVISSIIDTELTDRQRTALTRIVIEGVPVEVVADQLGTNRNNIYKIVHDARKKLRRELEARDWRADDVLRAFEDDGGPT